MDLSLLSTVASKGSVNQSQFSSFGNLTQEMGWMQVNFLKRNPIIGLLRATKLIFQSGGSVEL